MIQGFFHFIAITFTLYILQFYVGNCFKYRLSLVH